MVDKDDITILDRYVAQGSEGGFLQGAWSRIRAELVAPSSASANSAMVPLHDMVLAWLGKYRDCMSSDAIESLQAILEQHQ